MTYLQNLWIKIKYSPWLRLFFDAMSKLGIRISPFYIYQEIISPEVFPRLPGGFEDYDIEFWGIDEINAISNIRGRPFSEQELLERLRNGCQCLGVKKDGELISFSWCNFREFYFKWQRFPLKHDEAYLFDAYTLPAYRGKGIAPFLRNCFHRELEKNGRTKLYSLSDYFNTPAVNFKKRLNAKKIKLNVYVEFFGKWNFSFTLIDYQGDKHPTGIQA